MKESKYFLEHPANLNEQDIRILLEIENEAFPIDHYNREQLLEEWERDPNLFIVARDNFRRPVGYITGDVRGKTGFIVSLAVSTIHRGHGLGGLLINIMTNWFKEKGLNIIKLQVRKDNEVAIKMFRRRGFLVESEIPDYYRDGVPALVMAKVLD